MMATAPTHSAPHTTSTPAPKTASAENPDLPEGMKETDVGAAYYMGNPSPFKIDEKIKELGDDPRIKSLSDAGVQNAAQIVAQADLAKAATTPPATQSTHSK